MTLVHAVFLAMFYGPVAAISAFVTWHAKRALLAAVLALIEANDGDRKVLIELFGVTGVPSPIYQAKGQQTLDGDFVARGSVDVAPHLTRKPAAPEGTDQ